MILPTVASVPMLDQSKTSYHFLFMGQDDLADSPETCYQVGTNFWKKQAPS